MDILEGDAVYETLLKDYSKNPRGWSFTVSQSSQNGFFDALVAGPDESWQLKLDTIFKPSPFVLGSRTGLGEKTGGSSPVSFGFRRMDPEEAPSLLDGSSQGMAKLWTFLHAANPVAPTARGNYIQGPFVFANPGRVGRSLNDEQKKVDRRLSDDMLRLVRRRYPNYF